MLPWLIAVLLVLNLCLFWWGQRHEVPIDPTLPPLPAAAYRIELLDPAGEAEAMIASAPPPASATMVSIPEQGAIQSGGFPQDPQSPSDPVTAEAAPSAAADAGNAPVATQTVDGTLLPPVAAEGVLTTPEATPGAEALLPTAIAAGAAGGAVAGSAVPKVAKKRKVKRRKAAKPVEPFHDF